MGLYLDRTRKGDFDPSRSKEEQLVEDGAIRMVHPRYQPYTVVVFMPDEPPHTVAAFVFSRREFWRFFNNPVPQMWYTYEGVKELMRPDTIRLHLADVKGEDTFESMDRREEMSALLKKLRDNDA